MNVKLKVLTAAMLAGFVGSALAAPIAGAPTPPIVSGGKVPGTAGAPPLSPPEKGAYTAIESVLQGVEATIYANGCGALKGTHLLSVSTDQSGNGTAELITPAGKLELDVELKDSDKLLGTHYDVDAYGTIGPFRHLKDFDGDAFFDKKGGIMTQDGEFKVHFPLTGNTVEVQGRVIKDFRVVGTSLPVFIDYGLQSLAKKGARKNDYRDEGRRYGDIFYPQVKYWQTSRHVRSNGIEGRTQINKQRLYNANGNTACSIVVDLKGFDDYDGFDQSGTLIVKTAAP